MKNLRVKNSSLSIVFAIAVGVFLFSAIAYAEQNSWYWYMNNGLLGNEITTTEIAQDKDFEKRWLAARDTDALRNLILLSTRKRDTTARQ